MYPCCSRGCGGGGGGPCVPPPDARVVSASQAYTTPTTLVLPVGGLPVALNGPSNTLLLTLRCTSAVTLTFAGTLSAPADPAPDADFVAALGLSVYNTNLPSVQSYSPAPPRQTILAAAPTHQNPVSTTWVQVLGPGTFAVSVLLSNADAAATDTPAVTVDGLLSATAQKL